VKSENKLGLLHLSLKELLRNAGELSLHLVEPIVVQHQELAVFQTLNIVATLAHVPLASWGRIYLDLLVLIDQQLRMVDNNVFNSEVLQNPGCCINQLLIIFIFVFASQLLSDVVLLWVNNREELSAFLH